MHFLRFNKEVAVFPPRLCIEKASAQGTCKLALSCLERSNCWHQLQQGCIQNPLPCFQMAIWSTWLTPMNSHSTEKKYIYSIYMCVQYMFTYTHKDTHIYAHTDPDSGEQSHLRNPPKITLQSIHYFCETHISTPFARTT